MKKLHGTYSIQPLTITDAVIAEDAQISESKLNLSFSTANIQQNVDDINISLASHLNSDTDPHGETLHQTILQTEDIQSDTSDSVRTITISNPGEGDVLLSVEGDISAVNASFSGDTNIAGITTIGGQTHITGNVVIDGNLSVAGNTTTVSSNTIDYDSLLVTPSTALNRTGIIVAPDGTGHINTNDSGSTPVADTAVNTFTDPPLTTSLLENYNADYMTKDSTGNIYCISYNPSANNIVKINNRYLSTQTLQVTNENIYGNEYNFGYTDTFGMTVSGDGSRLFITCDPYTPEDCNSMIYIFDTEEGVCAQGDAIQCTGYTDNSFSGTWYGAAATDFVNDHLVFLTVPVSENIEDPQFNITVVDTSNRPVKTINITGADYTYSSYICVSPDGAFVYGVTDAEEPLLWKVPLDGSTSYDLDSSEECVSSILYEEVSADVFGYVTGLAINDGRLFVSTITGYIFEIDPDTLEIIDSSGQIFNDSDANNDLNCMEANANYVVVGCTLYEDNNETYSLFAFDISDNQLLSESTLLTETDLADNGYNSNNNTVNGDTFTGNLLELQKRVNGLNSAAVIVDKDGNLKLLTGGLDVNGVKGETVNNVLTFNKALASTAVTTSDAGFVYKPSSDNQPNNKALDIQDASGVSNAFITKNGDTTVNSLIIGASNPITEVGTGLNVPNDVCIDAAELLLSDSVLTFAAENKDEWRVLNRNSSVSFYYDTENVPQVELSDDLFDLTNCETTKTDDLVVMGNATFNGSVSMAANMTVDGIKVGSHDHTGGDMGTVLPQTAVTGLKTFVDNINTTIKNCVNEMTSSNTESGINVAYNSTSGKLNFAVNDFTLTLSGNASGSATVQHASNTTLSVTVLDSAKLGGLSLSSSTANTDANRVLRTDANGKTSVKALFMSSPTAAGTGTLGKIYASAGNETEVKVYTPANFATQILALGGTTKNSHTHTEVNGLTPIRGSSTFNGVSGRVIMLSSSRANTNYSVAVTPTAQPNGNLGEVWVIKATDRFTVYNSGSATTAFDYIMLG